MSCSCSDSTLYSTGCCCGGSECLPPEPSQGSPGQQGEPGSPGEPGANGVNSYSTVSVAGVVPAVGNSVALTLENAEWVIDGQNLYLEGIGYYEAISHTDTTVTVENLGAPGNAAPATAIPIATGIGPAGYEGPALIAPLPIADGGTGEDNATDAFTALSPITTRGDVIIGTVGGVPVRLALGTNGYVLSSNGTDVVWAVNAPVATNITGILPVASGGTGGNTPSAARSYLSAAGISSSNTFTASNSWDVTSSFFNVFITGSSLLKIDPSGSVWTIGDWSGIQSVDIQNRRLTGAWTQTVKSYATANASTYNSWTNIETVVSTYTTTGTQAITLPAGTDGRTITIKDGSRNATVNNITISRSGSDTIEGATTYVIDTNGGVVTFMFFSATTDWKVM